MRVGDICIVLDFGDSCLGGAMVAVVSSLISGGGLHMLQTFDATKVPRARPDNAKQTKGSC
jgi:hypothetical protein